jgi:hypothetical protein
MKKLSGQRIFLCESGLLEVWIFGWKDETVRFTDLIVRSIYHLMRLVSIVNGRSRSSRSAGTSCLHAWLDCVYVKGY